MAPFEAREIGRVEPNPQMGGLLVVLPLQDAALVVEPSQGGPIAERYGHLHGLPTRAQTVADRGAQGLQAIAGPSGYRKASAVFPAAGQDEVSLFLAHEVGLVEHLHLVPSERLVQPKVLEDGQNIVLLRKGIRMGDVAHVQDQIGFQDLFEGRSEGGDQSGREIVKISDDAIVPTSSLKNVSVPANTTYRSETYFQDTRLATTAVHVAHLAGWYVSRPEQLRRDK